jgi:hypothetical protein
LVISFSSSLYFLFKPCNKEGNIIHFLCKIKSNQMRQNAGLLTQHVSGTSMPIIRSTIVIPACWCPNLESCLRCVALGC